MRANSVAMLQSLKSILTDFAPHLLARSALLHVTMGRLITSSQEPSFCWDFASTSITGSSFALRKTAPSLWSVYNCP